MRFAEVEAADALFEREQRFVDLGAFEPPLLRLFVPTLCIRVHACFVVDLSGRDAAPALTTAPALWSNVWI